MLMNQNKNKISSPRADINLSDLNELDNINLTEPSKKLNPRPSFTDVTSNLFAKPTENINLKINEMNKLTKLQLHLIPLKQATATNTVKRNRRIYKTFNEIPVTPTAHQHNQHYHLKKL